MSGQCGRGVANVRSMWEGRGQRQVNVGGAWPMSGQCGRGMVNVGGAWPMWEGVANVRSMWEGHFITRNTSITQYFYNTILL